MARSANCMCEGQPLLKATGTSATKPARHSRVNGPRRATNPFEVESALITHKAVFEAAVIGREDAYGLMKPKAFVVLKPGVESGEALFEDLKSHVKAAAGPWKYPRWIEARQELPKTATGKIQRFKLRAE